MNLTNLIPQDYLIGLAITAGLGAIAGPSAFLLQQVRALRQELKSEISKRLEITKQEKAQFLALLNASLEEIRYAQEDNRPISPDAVKERALALMSEASDVFEALVGKDAADE